MNVKLNDAVLERIHTTKEALRARCAQPNHNEKLNLQSNMGDTSIAILISSHMEMQSDYFGFREMLLNVATLTNGYTKSEAVKCYQLAENLLRRFKNTFPEMEECEQVVDQIGDYMTAKKETLQLMKALSLPEITMVNALIQSILEGKQA
jgi:hypothetical protein